MENSKPYNIFDMAQQQFDRIADLLGLDQPTRDFLRIPMREYQFSLPVFMDDGEARVFRGYVVQYNDVLGPTKGGVRFHPQETIDTIRALGMWMTWKCAVTNLPLGGSSSGVVCDPHTLSFAEQERICRGFVRRVAHLTGPTWDVLGPDVMTGPQHMLWMLDEYEAIHQQKSPGFITGKPVGHAGSKGRQEACGYGVMITVREALKDLGLAIDQTSASFQGFGMVGMYAAQLYQQMGGVIACVSTWDHADRTAYAYRKKGGIDFEELASITNPFGEVDKARAEALGYERLPGEAWLAQDVDILVPAALEHQIHAGNVGQISRRVKIIAEGANGPTDSDVDEVLRERGVMIIPDILANAGGVVCSYFEQVQSNMNYFWSKDEVLSKLDSHMTSAYIDVSTYANRHRLSLRDAAYILAVDRVARACHERGWV
ncbi:MAG TPA: glutamate dehydrogenase [Anaerolinea thermolimosa]|uniref:Glutamate dehydrogenase n=1 Tax=Anaerolinea thermolimosa TaxID=229919 RepID=A0A3D1JEM0_9CHLR|nr:glutamate dehydrogenase [Anaerolinea thermolimosa]